MEVDHDKLTNISIPPMLLLGFVENALKHGHQAGLEVCEVVFSLHINDQTLHFRSENPFREALAKTAESGIGLQNSRERLQLLFGDAAQLNIEASNGRFLLQAQWPLSPQNPQHPL
jgi:LytS/YehU family sensor histidine kinase